MYYSGCCLELLLKATRRLSRDVRCSGRNSAPASPECYRCINLLGVYTVSIRGEGDYEWLSGYKFGWGYQSLFVATKETFAKSD
jgi:hypothetical protein